MNRSEKWQAVLDCDSRYDGRWFYAVKSTGIFCRPSCTSRPPLASNVVYFDTAPDAIAAGYRPCKRCRPDLLDYRPAISSAEAAKAAIDRHYADREALSAELAAMGLSKHRITEIFEAQYGQTPTDYADSLRFEAAKAHLSEGNKTILDIALCTGFDSLSSFYDFFYKHTHMAPGAYRRLRGDHPSQAHEITYLYDSPLGKIAIASAGRFITAIRFATGGDACKAVAGDPLTDRAARQLEAYFAGRLTRFELPLNPAGTPFQQSVWRALTTIPYGETRSYKQVAGQMGNPGASRAVGAANNKNPLLIVVPCHRVVGSKGDLVGYAAGLDIKKQLLELERSHRQASHSG